MLLNQDVALSTPVTLLVPYEPHHVPEYHEWMQRPELQELTASEPLSLDEEYAMQASWRTDADKLTFIVCLPFAGRPDMVRAGTDDSPDQMIGDINLFVSEEVTDEEVGAEASAANGGAAAATSSDPSKPLRLVGEVEIMIAKPGMTGQGRGRASLLAFLRYVHDHQAEICRAYAAGKGLREIGLAPEQLQHLCVKIGQGNVRSVGLFQSLGFVGDTSQHNVFGEVELRLGADLADALRGWDEKWSGSVAGVLEVPYEREFQVDVVEEGMGGVEGEGGEDTEMAD